ncbi:uncharacterized protein LOC126705205 [Quercus robur]|uniref:uncharacterized protein LOC126705205 n=1 Tax=Quercus robur TaxID=38942 RepID=UPI0021626AD4|nr:uncharacterized protein LOC126705205 [Quercus robur]
MQEGETLKAYSNRYWEMYNEIEGNYDDVAISTFKSGLPTEHGLRKSLTGKAVTSLRQLMNRINKYKRVEEDQQLGQANIEARKDTSLRPPMGIINVILATPRRTDSCPSKVMSVARLPSEHDDRKPKKAKTIASPVLGFLDEDKVRTIQPHDDALVVTLRIGGYDVRTVLVDQGSAVEVMYPNLYKG